MARIGVYICHCGLNIAGIVNTEEVAAYSATLPNVVVAKHYTYVCSEPGQKMIKEDIRQNRLDRIVIASCSPKMHEETFRQTIAEAGLNPYLLEMVNLREQCSWCHSEKPEEATEKAKDLVKIGVARANLLEPLYKQKVKAEKSVLVVGGGIAGIQAALDLANIGFKVHLVEKSPTLGGKMAQLDKTFPTLDCSACILTPKMVQAARHPNIKLWTYAEVESVNGFVGNYEVTILKKPRYIDENKCTGCGECEKVCPVELPNEFELGLSKRKAVYRPFPQAIPNVYTIDKRGIPPCRASCPAGVNVQGYVALVSQRKFEEAYQLLKRYVPIPAVLGRVCFHPCESECERGELDEPIAINAIKRFITDYISKKKMPLEALPKVYNEKIAVIGSGPAGLAAAYELAKKGYPVTVFEALPEPGGMLRVGIPSYRLPREILDREIEALEALGIAIKTNSVFGKDFDLKDLEHIGYKAVFLAIGAQKSRKLLIEGEQLDGVFPAMDFLRKVNLGGKVQVGRSVAVIGGGNVAIDAARTALRLGAEKVYILYRRSRKEMPAFAPEVKEAEKEGVEILFLTAPKRILGNNGRVAGIECLKMRLGEPDETGRRTSVPVKGSEHIIEVDMVIPAIGQSLDTSLLPEEIKVTQRGLIKVDPKTLQTSLPHVFAGGDAVLGPATVIDAIATGKQAATFIHQFLRKGKKTAVVEEEETLPVIRDISKEGVPKKKREKMPKLPVKDRIKSFAEVELGFDEEAAVEEAKRCLACAGCSECLECEKVCELEGTINHLQRPERINIKVGAVILAVGGEIFNAEKIAEYGYKRFPNVISNLQFERLSNASGPTNGKILCPSTDKKPKSIAFIQCVGCRDERFNKYCCRVGCMITLKQAILAKEKLGEEVNVYICFNDIRAFGKGYEEFYRRAREMGIQTIAGLPSEIHQKQDGSLYFDVYDLSTNKLLTVNADLVVLANGLVPRQDFEKIQNIFRVSRSPDGFLLEAHPKLKPLETATKGIYLAGTCQGPKDIPDTVAQASGAAAKAAELLASGEIEIEPLIAVIDEELCSRCGICKAICAYGAIEIESLEDGEQRIEVIEVLCQGCGSCASSCPVNAIKMRHYTDEQILAQIRAFLASFEVKR